MAKQKTSLTTPRIVRLELEWTDREEDWARLAEIAEQLRRAANRMSRAFVDYHEAAGTVARLRAYDAWLRGGKVGDAPPAAGAACPPALQKRWYHLLAEYDTIHERPRALLLSWIASTISSQDSPKSNCKRWRQVLLDQERPWYFHEPLPIRFDGRNAHLREEDGTLWLVARVIRPALGQSTPLRLRVRSSRENGTARQADLLAKWLSLQTLAVEDRHLAGGQIYHERGRWFAAFTIDRELERIEGDAKKVLFLRPGRHDPWRIRCAGVSGGFGRGVRRGDQLPLHEEVALARQDILLRRASRRGVADFATLRPTRVRRRLEGSLRGKWNRVCTLLNRRVVREIVGAVEKHNIGRVVVLPGRRTCWLETAGKQEDLPDTTSFPLHQFTRFLRESLVPRGVSVESRASLRSVKRRKAVAQQKKKRSRV